MIAVRLGIKVTGKPLQRTPAVLRLDADGCDSGLALTGRFGVARFEHLVASGKVLVGGIERCRYLLDLFPRAGAQQQDDRLAGLRRTRGEH